MIDFGLMFFASSEEAMAGDKYRLVLESARFADSHDFSSVWLPERHFTEFGSLYPNPAVLHAALAATTRRVRLQAGSVVAPLHHPARIAEEWSMVDNLSRGRVGVSFAAGWNPNDFVLAPDHYADRADRLLADIDTVRRLWRGESFEGVNGSGERAAVRVYPTPVQRELPIWLTVAGNPRNFERAGELGLNLLTHLLDQDEQQLAEKIGLYRRARAAHGWDPATGRVSVMLHTFVGADAERVRAMARGPYCDYIRQNVGLLNGLARSRGQQVDLNAMSERELQQFVEFLYERFAQSRGLIGTPESCLPLVRQLEAMGVDEAACLLDFGPPVEQILEHLVHLDRLRELARPATASDGFDPTLIRARCPVQLDGDVFDRQLREFGLQISGDFQLLRQVWQGSDEALGELTAPMPSVEDRGPLPPAFLDACSRVVVAALEPARIERGALYLPSGVAAVRLHRPLLGGQAWSHARLRRGGDDALIEADVEVYDGTGQPLISLESLRLRRVSAVHGQPAKAVDDTAALCYRRDWLAVEPPVVEPSRRDWLLVGGPAGQAESLAAALRQQGDGCHVLADGDDLATILAISCSDLVMLGALQFVADAADAIKAAATFTTRVLATLTGLVELAGGGPRLWLISAGALPVLEGEQVRPAQTALAGLAQSIAIEHPRQWGGLLDLACISHRPPAAAAETLALARSAPSARLDVLSSTPSPPLSPPSAPPRRLDGLATECSEKCGLEAGAGSVTALAMVLARLHGGQGEVLHAWRDGRLWVPRLRHWTIAPGAAEPAFDAQGSYLITGGAGGLGGRLAEWLLQHGAGAVAVLGRSLDEAGAPEAAIHRYRCDVGERAALAKTLRRIRAELPPLKGVFHLAGTLDDARLLEQDAPRLLATGHGKLAGAWHLHELTRADALTHFVMFSSLASLVTMPGQGNYARANAFLDGLAWHRYAEGRPGLSVNWGPWADIGHARSAYGELAHGRLAAIGVDALAPASALRALGEVLATGEPQAAIAVIDWRRVAASGDAMAAQSVLSELLETDAASAPVATPAEAASAGDPQLLGWLRESRGAARQALLLADLKSLFAEVLRIEDIDAVSLHASLFDLGLDSILALDLTRRLSERYGQPFQATLFFTHPSLQALAEHVWGALAPSLDSAVATASKATVAAAPAQTQHVDEDELSRLIAEEIGRR